MILPWESGSPPLAWVERVKREVDLVMVPSEYVREGYVAGGMPPGVVEWITSPVHAGEAMARINAVLSTRGEPSRAPSAPMAGGGDRYQFAFDGNLDELAGR